jgi:transposase
MGSSEIKPYYSPLGRPPIDPVLMIRTLIVGYVFANRSGARNLVERFFNKIQQRRRVATRCDRLAANYLAFIQLASIRLWLGVNELCP